MELRRINITAQEWQKLIDRVNKLSESNRKDFEDSRNNTYIRTDGLAQVPITNKEWAKWVGYEHDEQTLWFRPRVSKTPSGFLIQKPISYVSALALARSVTWNAALYIHLLNKPLAPKAIYGALAQSLKVSNCPSDMLSTVLKALEELCLSTLDALSDSDGSINRCSIQILKNELSGKLGRRNCSNRTLRKAICMKLLVNGIASLKTRREQQVMLLAELKKTPKLKGLAVHSIERALRLDPTILNATDGICVLLPYTEEELSEIRSSASTQGLTHDIAQRASDIINKIKAGKALSSAERKFKCLHKDLF